MYDKSDAYEPTRKFKVERLLAEEKGKDVETLVNEWLRGSMQLSLLNTDIVKKLMYSEHS